jgi:hypothetical protein
MHGPASKLSLNKQITFANLTVWHRSPLDLGLSREINLAITSIEPAYTWFVMLVRE